jgi:hypothetical protein
LTAFELEFRASAFDHQTHGVTANVVSRSFVLRTGIGESNYYE